MFAPWRRSNQSDGVTCISLWCYIVYDSQDRGSEVLSHIKNNSDKEWWISPCMEVELRRTAVCNETVQSALGVEKSKELNGPITWMTIQYNCILSIQHQQEFRDKCMSWFPFFISLARWMFLIMTFRWGVGRRGLK